MKHHDKDQPQMKIYLLQIQTLTYHNIMTSEINNILRKESIQQFINK